MQVDSMQGRSTYLDDFFNSIVVKKNVKVNFLQTENMNQEASYD